jgi:hypothetical protein
LSSGTGMQGTEARLSFQDSHLRTKTMCRLLEAVVRRRVAWLAHTYSEGSLNANFLSRLFANAMTEIVHAPTIAEGNQKPSQNRVQAVMPALGTKPGPSPSRKYQAQKAVAARQRPRKKREIAHEIATITRSRDSKAGAAHTNARPSGAQNHAAGSNSIMPLSSARVDAHSRVSSAERPD